MIRKILGALAALFLFAGPAGAQTTPWSTFINGSTDIVTLTDTAKFGLSIGAASTRTATGLEIQAYLNAKNNTWSGTNTFNSTVSGTGVTSLFASPPAIGGTAAAAGTFTTLAATTFSIGGTSLSLPVSVTNGGWGLSTLTSNAIYKGNGTSAPAVSALTDNGTIISTSEPFDLTSQSLVEEIANAGVTGTTVNKLAKLSGATVQIAATSDTDNIEGLVIGGAGTSGNAQLARIGQASCVFDGATTAGDYVIVSSTTGGDCHDTGSATAPTATQIIGRVTTTNGSAGTYNVALNLSFRNVGGGGGSVSITAGNSGIVVSPSPLTGTGTISLGNPSASTLGGIESYAAVSHQWINAISTSGVPSSTQPAFSDLSGSATLAQFPTIATNTVLGNSSGSTTTPSAQTIGAGLVMNANGLQTTIADSTKSANYTVAAGDMGGQINLTGTATLTIPAISSTILTTGMSVCWYNQGSGTWTISSTPTINGMNSTSVAPGAAGCLIGNGSTLDFVPGVQPPTTTVLGSVLSKDCSSGSQFVQKINTDGTISCATPSGAGTVSVVGSGTLTNNAPVIGGGTQLVQTTAAMTNGQILVGVTSGAPAPQTMSGDATLNSSGVISVTKLGGVSVSGSFLNAMSASTAMSNFGGL